MADPTQPAPVDKGFPNPLHPDFPGERTPEEQVAFDAEQAKRAAIADAAAPAETTPDPLAPPANPTGTPGAAW